MTDANVTLGDVVGMALIVGGLVGTVAALLGAETISPAYFAVAIAAGSAELSGAVGLCHLREYVPV
jgi:hypothetical protein